MFGLESSCKHTLKAFTVTLKLHCPAPPGPGALHVTVVVPIGKQKPDAGVQIAALVQVVTGTGVGAGKFTGTHGPAIAGTVISAGQVITQFEAWIAVNASMFGLR